MQPPLTDKQFKHTIDYDSRLLPYKYYHTCVMDGIPDILFHWHNEFEINYVYGGQPVTISTMIISIVKLVILS